jgi:hypothetical protein
LVCEQRQQWPELPNRPHSSGLSGVVWPYQSSEPRAQVEPGASFTEASVIYEFNRRDALIGHRRALKDKGSRSFSIVRCATFALASNTRDAAPALTIPFRFHRRIRLLPGVQLNLNRSGVGASVGRRALWLTYGRRRVGATVGLPGSGLGSQSAQQPARLPNTPYASFFFQPAGNTSAAPESKDGLWLRSKTAGTWCGPSRSRRDVHQRSTSYAPHCDFGCARSSATSTANPKSFVA